MDFGELGRVLDDVDEVLVFPFVEPLSLADEFLDPPHLPHALIGRFFNDAKPAYHDILFGELKQKLCFARNDVDDVVERVQKPLGEVAYYLDPVHQPDPLFELFHPGDVLTCDLYGHYFVLADNRIGCEVDPFLDIPLRLQPDVGDPLKRDFAIEYVKQRSSDFFKRVAGEHLQYYIRFLLYLGH